MEVEWLLVIHGLVTLLVLVSFLCGQWPIFEGTFIQKIHLFLTFGACDYFRRFVCALFGQKGSDALFCVEYYCCDRPNPTLQVIYLGIIGASYYLIVQSSFKYIPGHYLGKVHRYLSLLAVGGGIILFLLTSFSDPGTVNAVNVSHYLSAYPYDNIIFSEKECPTCKIPKHFLLCLYGAVAIALVLAGRMKELRVIDILTVYYGFEKSFSSLAPHVVVTFKWQEYISWKRKVNEAKASAAALKASLGELNHEKKHPVSKWKAFFQRSRIEEVEVVKNNIYDKGMLQNVIEIVVPLSTRRSFLQRKSKSG